MRLHCLTHVPYEGPGCLTAWSRERGHELLVHRLFADGVPPPPADGDGLIVMGGPMSVHDTAVHPWLAGEKQLIREAIARVERQQAGFVLGFCLGAQLICEALGGEVLDNGGQEIGWWPVEHLADSGPFSGWPAQFSGFHWHGERCRPPAGITPLARSAVCPVQAFAAGPRVFAFQFHPEVTRDDAEAFVAANDTLPAGEGVQPAAAMLAEPDTFTEQNARLSRGLDRWLGEL